APRFHHHRYLYARNSPTTFVDPSGLSAEGDALPPRPFWPPATPPPGALESACPAPPVPCLIDGPRAPSPPEWDIGNGTAQPVFLPFPFPSPTGAIFSGLPWLVRTILSKLPTIIELVGKPVQPSSDGYRHSGRAWSSDGTVMNLCKRASTS